MMRSRRRCNRQSGASLSLLAIALLVASLTTHAATASNSSGTAGISTEQSNDPHQPNGFHKLRRLLPSFLFKSAAEQQQEIIKPPPSESLASRTCGAGSNADQDGECVAADAAASGGGGGAGDNNGEEEESAFVASTIDPETCAKRVAEDATRCVHPESRPEMLGRCADACRDIAGITAKGLTEEQMYEDAVRGYVYYYHVPDEEEEESEEGNANQKKEEKEEHECIDYEERCEEWIWVHDGCLHNYEYMSEYCPKSCHVCHPKREVNVINFGVPQLTNYHDDEETNAAIRENIEETAEYMLHHVLVEEQFENVRRDCFNFDPKCSYYAATGWCTDELELRWMQTTCGPACSACMTVGYWHQFGSTPDVENAVDDEEMVPLFERIKKFGANAWLRMHNYKNKEIWSDFTANKMNSHLKCSEYYQRAEQTIHGQDAWKQMRRKYVDIVGGTESTIGPPESGYNGFSKPYYVGHNEYGRGIYAKTDIPKGSLVWHNIRSAAFSEGQQFREFVMTLPRELGCDVLQWSYVKDGKIYCDLDEGSFCNDGHSDGSNIDIDEAASAKFIAKAGMQLFATRDVKKGEELLCNYSSFSDGDWRLFGL